LPRTQWTPEDERTLVDTARALVAQLRGETGEATRVGLSDSLERDLGLDSLARMELLMRVQRAFGVDLPQRTLERSETLADIADALARARASREGPAPAGRPGTEVVSPPGAPARGRAPGAVGPAAGETDAEALEPPEQARTLLEVLDWHLGRHPRRTQITLLEDERATAVDYETLARMSERAAAGLQRLGLAPRETVAIMLPTSLEYFYVYLGILRAGAVPVPIYPPARLTQIEEHVRRHARILANARAAVMVTVPEARPVARLLQAQVPALREIVGADDLLAAAEPPAPVALDAGDVAFVQYTSGSTGDPKGVVLTHANLLANIRAMGPALGVRAGDVFVSWLPLYHDMGLIGAWLGTLYFGLPLVVMSPLAFLARPVRWLRAIHAYGGTLSAAPNFAYELCASKIDDAELEGLDLSRWRIAANGAEAVLPDTLARFGERFAPYGLRREALTPVYGLAECSVGLAFPPQGRGPRVDVVAREAFARSGQALPASADEPNPLRFVACGRAIPGHGIRVVDEQEHPLAERLEGRVEFRGPSATAGYLDNPKATAQLIRDGWLDTGDRGYLADGELFLTGRVKDIVIRGGRNIYPHEVEEAVSEVDGVRKGCVAVFGSPEPASGTERLVVLAETRLGAADARERLRAAITERVLAALGEPPDAVVLAPPHTVLKTSSGKVRRSACRELFESGRVGARQHGGRWQMARLALEALLPTARRVLGRAGRVAFGAWVWLVFWLLAPAVWTASVLARRHERAWAISRAGARALLRLAGIPLETTGLEHLPREGPCVLVANHSSYADGIVVVAALPRPCVFVAKRELRGQAIAGRYLSSLGARYVERFAAEESVRDAQLLRGVVEEGRPLFFFPEGTFTRVAGLRAFRLGAFVVAADTGAPVVPVAIHGTRALLPEGSWLPRRARLRVSVGAPRVAPADAGDAFAAALAMRDSARAFITEQCGEADLAAGNRPRRT